MANAVLTTVLYGLGDDMKRRARRGAWQISRCMFGESYLVTIAIAVSGRPTNIDEGVLLAICASSETKGNPTKAGL